MTRAGVLALLAVWVCAACTLLNPAEQHQPEPNRCDGGSCDQDACDVCDPLASCSGGSCRCPRGYLDPDGDGTRCEPEPRPACRSNGDCGQHGVCDLQSGSAVCRCEDGYARQEGRCKNIDECALEQDDCPQYSRCVDEDGDHSCACVRGYSLVGDECVDDDECAAEPCGEHALCVNEPGSHSCSCEPGYTGNAFDGCTDSDECARGELQCGERASCQPRPGPDGCVCDPYYSDVHADGSECKDDRIEWILWNPRLSDLSTASANASGGGPQDERVATIRIVDRDVSLCDQVFTPGPSVTRLLAVLDADGGCRWARSLAVNGGTMTLAVDDAGAITTSMYVIGEATVDGRVLGSTSASFTEIVLHFAPGGALAWAVPVPCQMTLVPNQRIVENLEVDAAGDIYATLRYDGACSIAGHALPPASGDNVAVIKLASADGSVRWSRPVVHTPGSTVGFKDLAVAADGNAYVAGAVFGDADFGIPTRVPNSGFVLALDRDGVIRWLQAVPGVLEVAAGSTERLHVMTIEMDAVGWAVDVLELDPRDAGERWRTRVATDAYSAVELGSDALGRTIVAAQVQDIGTIGGKPLPATQGGLWASLIALDAFGAIMWSHALVPYTPALSLAELTASGNLFVTGGCAEACEIGGESSDAPATFALRMRL
jgi:hypothetical protein